MSLDVVLSEGNDGDPIEVYSASIRHNLAEMAMFAGLYTALWHPDELGIETAQELVPYLMSGYVFLKKCPNRCKELEPLNKCCKYEDLLLFTADYIRACKEHPTSHVAAYI